jgi:class 3 adenylate cyclase
VNPGVVTTDHCGRQNDEKIEVPSVVDAVRCAVEVQRGMADRNAKTGEEKRITFRVGSTSVT